MVRPEVSEHLASPREDFIRRVAVNDHPVFPRGKALESRIQLPGKVGLLLYFFAGNVQSATYELWVTDAWGAGATKLISSTAFGSVSRVTPAGGRAVLFPNRTSAAGNELWMSNGSTGGTVLLKDLVAGTADGLNSPVFGMINGTMYFTPNLMLGTTDIWQTDLTPAGTTRAVVVNGAGLYLSWFTPLGNAMLFAGSAIVDDGDLWRSDGTQDGTWRIGATTLGNASSLFDYMTGPAFSNAGETIYFSATDSQAGAELWRTVAGATPGSLAGAQRVADLYPGGYGSTPQSIVMTADGSVYFTAETPVTGREVYRISPDGGDTPQLVADLFPGTTGSSPRGLVAIGNAIFFTATSSSTESSTTLWRYEPSAGAPARVKIGTNVVGRSNGNTAMVQVGSYWYFAGERIGSVGGIELYPTAGYDATAELVSDVYSGSSSSYPTLLTALGSTLFFLATDSAGTELWKSDGTSAGTQRVADLTPGSGSTSFGNAMSAFGSAVYFGAKPGTTGATDQLYRSDGTTAGTVPVAALNTVYQFAAAAGQLFFLANDALGRSAFRYTGSNAPVRITPVVSTDGLTLLAYGAYAAGGRVFIVEGVKAGNATQRFELWSYDAASGPIAATKFMDIQPYVSSAYAPGLSGYWFLGQSAMVANSTHLFFPAYRTELGVEPYALPLTDPVGMIRGVVYDDRNRNGVQDGAEPVLAGRTIFVDIDFDGVADMDEPQATTGTDGAYSITGLDSRTFSVRAEASGGWAPLDPSGVRSVTVSGGAVDGVEFGLLDVLPPSVTGGGPDTARAGAPLALRFTEDVSATLDATDVVIIDLSTDVAVDPAAIRLKFDSATLVATIDFPNFPNAHLGNGNYRMMLNAGCVTDAAGNPLAADVKFDFFVLAGDADRSRDVGLNDLLRLANHYALSGVSWADGDFDGDGIVGLNDLLILANHYGTALPAPAAPVPAVPVPPALPTAAPTVAAAPTTPPSPATAATATVIPPAAPSTPPTTAVKPLQVLASKLNSARRPVLVHPTPPFSRAAAKPSRSASAIPQPSKNSPVPSARLAKPTAFSATPIFGAANSTKKPRAVDDAIWR